MNYRMIFRILGLTLLLFSALLLLPAVAALCFGEAVLPFLLTAAISAAVAGLFLLIRPKTRAIYAREGFVAVSLTWIFMSLIGALPFLFSGEIPRYIDALFETVSGFTTTGATILTDVEAMSHGCLFWRSFTHWIGGLGVLVFVMAVLPMSGDYSMHIMKAEVPGPVVGKLVPRAKDTARILYIMYAVMTLAETILLLCGGMSFFDALLHAFGTAGTGGFSTRNASVGAYGSAYIEMVIAVFLVLFGINFNLYYLMLIGRIREALKSEELHCYLLIIALATVAIALGISVSCGGIGQGFRTAFFTVASIISTAGFSTADFTSWPGYTLVILLALMFIGGCAGSTGGGLKVSRVMILSRDARADIARMVSPKRVRAVRMDGRCVEESVTGTVCSFFFLYMLIILVCTFLVSFDGFDFLTGFTAAVTCISNVGPGLSAQIGPSGNFAAFSALSKIVMTLTMLFGRLEIYPMLILAGRLFRKR